MVGCITATGLGMKVLDKAFHKGKVSSCFEQIEHLKRCRLKTWACFCNEGFLYSINLKHFYTLWAWFLNGKIRRVSLPEMTLVIFASSSHADTMLMNSPRDWWIEIRRLQAVNTFKRQVQLYFLLYTQQNSIQRCGVGVLLTKYMGWKHVQPQSLLMFWSVQNCAHQRRDSVLPCHYLLPHQLSWPSQQTQGQPIRIHFSNVMNLLLLGNEAP